MFRNYKKTMKKLDLKLNMKIYIKMSNHHDSDDSNGDPGHYALVVFYGCHNFCEAALKRVSENYLTFG